MCFFSVIIPVYNAVNYLNFCVESVIKQSFDDFEIILIDDGSTDGSAELCDRWSNDVSFIKTKHKQNEGVFLARKSGLDIAEGEYIVFLDADDCLAGDALKRIHIEAEQTNPDMILFRWRNIASSGKLLASSSSAVFSEGDVAKADLISVLISSTIMNSMCIKACKRILFHSDLNYSKYCNVRGGEDLIQTLPLVENANAIRYINKELYYYRMNPNSVTHNKIAKKYMGLDAVRPLLYDYMCRMGYDTDEYIESYYKFYLATVFDAIVDIFCSENGDKLALYNEVASYQHVVKAMDYLERSDVEFNKKKVLRLFYEKKYDAMHRSLKVIVVKNKVTRFLARIMHKQ